MSHIDDMLLGPVLLSEVEIAFNMVGEVLNIEKQVLRVRVMVFNATFNNVSATGISWRFYWWRKPEYPKKTTCRKWLTNFIGIRTHNLSFDLHWLHR